MEFFHGPVIALNRRRHECFQRIDNNRRHRMSATVTEVARFKTASWPLVCYQNNELRPLIAGPMSCVPLLLLLQILARPLILVIS